MRNLLCLFLLALCAASPARAVTNFDLHRDTFAFSNDTYFKYGVDEQGHLHITQRDVPAQFAHRCFVLTRAVLQFHQFARFDPHRGINTLLVEKITAASAEQRAGRAGRTAPRQ